MRRLILALSLCVSATPTDVASQEMAVPGFVAQFEDPGHDPFAREPYTQDEIVITAVRVIPLPIAHVQDSSLLDSPEVTVQRDQLSGLTIITVRKPLILGAEYFSEEVVGIGIRSPVDEPPENNVRWTWALN